MATNPYYPVFLDLSGRRCLVIGGGRIARDKIRGLLEAGAGITVISPGLLPVLEQEVRAGRLLWEQRPYLRGDLSGAFLAIAATGDPAVNLEVFQEATESGCLINTVDRPDLCSYITPSVLRRGDLTVAISTHGIAPALAALIRRFFERRLGEGLGDFLQRAAGLRRKIARSGESPRARRAAWLRAVAHEAPSLLEASPRRKPPPARAGARLAAPQPPLPRRGESPQLAPPYYLGLVGADLAHGSIESVEGIWERLADSDGAVAELAAMANSRGKPLFEGTVILAGRERAELYYQTAYPRLARKALLRYLAPPDTPPPPTAAAAGEPYACHNVQAALHLFSVAAGLGSIARFGSGELGELRRGLDEAGLRATLTPLLTELFTAALALGRRSTGPASGGKGGGNLLERVVQAAAERIPAFSQSWFILVGEAERSGAALPLLVERGVAGERIAVIDIWRLERNENALLPWAEAQQPDGRRQAVIIANAPGGGGRPSITREQLDVMRRAGFSSVRILDMGLPRMAGEALGRLPGVTLWNLESMARMPAGAEPISGGNLIALKAQLQREARRFMERWAGDKNQRESL